MKKTYWQILKNEYDATVIEKVDDDSVIIKIDNSIYEYQFMPSKIREIDGEWTGKIISFLKTRHCRVFRPTTEEFRKPINEILERKESERIWSPTNRAPGKYKDKTWEQVLTEDIGYIEWIVRNTRI